MAQSSWSAGFHTNISHLKYNSVTYMYVCTYILYINLFYLCICRHGNFHSPIYRLLYIPLNSTLGALLHNSNPIPSPALALHKSTKRNYRTVWPIWNAILFLVSMNLVTCSNMSTSNFTTNNNNPKESFYTNLSNQQNHLQTNTNTTTTDVESHDSRSAIITTCSTKYRHHVIVSDVNKH